jgi:chemotaxis protein CheY-P-specific phosphatase CheC
MTPKEKALELIDDMHDAPEMGYNEHAKQCALIAVDEIMNVIIGSYDYELEKIYWQDVKNEILAL